MVQKCPLTSFPTRPGVSWPRDPAGRILPAVPREFRRRRRQIVDCRSSRNAHPRFEEDLTGGRSARYF